MKYVILIHSNPDPWGHPTSSHHGRGARPSDRAARGDGTPVRRAMEEISASGEFVVAEALAAPGSSTVYGWGSDGPLATDGPYAETKEQLAGFFLIDCETRERAEQIAARFACPGDVIELRPAMWAGADEA